MDQQLYFESHEECLRYAQWLRNFLPKPNPLENDAEFYAVVAFIINITFDANSSEPRDDATIDVFLHTGKLLKHYLTKHPVTTTQAFTHAFAHLFILSVYSHSDHSKALSEYQAYFEEPFAITLSDNEILAHFAALDYNRSLLSTDVSTLRQKLAGADPTQLSPDPSKKILLEEELSEFLSRCDTALRHYMLWGIGVLVVGAVAAIAVGALLHLMLPLLVGIVALAIGISGSVGAISDRLCSNSQTFFTSEDPDSFSFSLTQPAFFR